MWKIGDDTMIADPSNTLPVFVHVPEICRYTISSTFVLPPRGKKFKWPRILSARLSNHTFVHTKQTLSTTIVFRRILSIVHLYASTHLPLSRYFDLVLFLLFCGLYRVLFASLKQLYMKHFPICQDFKYGK